MNKVVNIANFSDKEIKNILDFSYRKLKSEKCLAIYLRIDRKTDETSDSILEKVKNIFSDNYSKENYFLKIKGDKLNRIVIVVFVYPFVEIMIDGLYMNLRNLVTPIRGVGRDTAKSYSDRRYNYRLFQYITFRLLAGDSYKEIQDKISKSLKEREENEKSNSNTDGNNSNSNE